MSRFVASASTAWLNNAHGRVFTFGACLMYVCCLSLDVYIACVSGTLMGRPALQGRAANCFAVAGRGHCFLHIMTLEPPGIGRA